MSAVRTAFVGALLLLGTLVMPAAARADAFHADFDGDGVRDHIDLTGPSTELDVRLSTSRAMQRLSADDVILHFVVTDIDRDGDPDVVARTRREGLQIWINTRGHFATHASKLQGLRNAGRLNGSSLSSRQEDDRACNDPTRELVSACSPRGQPVVASCGTATPPGASELRFQHSPRIARGPPSAFPRSSFA